ncbi:MAG: MFS transporter [Gammaproteobacteria bacterium]|nr:MFS transporter [Gammaproteobacteria bacterium]MDH5322406.1 MFS transporter [Gammaproteobacteria bacterium]
MKPGFVITLGLLTGLAALTVDISLPAVPVMAMALAASLSSSQQIVGVFIAGMAVGQIPAGLASDRAGRLPVLYAGMLLFLGGAVAASLASRVDVLLAARFVQGIGAAAAIALPRAIVRDIARGKDAARLMSLMTMIFTAVPVIAPSIGALLITQWGWRAPFIAIAALGLLLVFAIRSNIHETHAPTETRHPLRQLASSFAEFFAHRQSIFGLLLIVLPPAGFMSMIALAASLVVTIYGFSIAQFGFIFAAAGVSILLGATLNRILVSHFDALRLIGIGIALMGISAAQLLLIAALDQAPFAWLWSCVCLFMLTIALTMPNATVIALDPLPKIAGVASSIIGTLQNICGAAGAIIGATIYDGSVRNSVIMMAVAGSLTVLVYLLRALFVPHGIVRHPDELARD